MDADAVLVPPVSVPAAAGIVARRGGSVPPLASLVALLAVVVLDAVVRHEAVVVGLSQGERGEPEDEEGDEEEPHRG